MDWDRRPGAASGAMLIDEVAYRGEGGGVLGKRRNQSRLEGGGAMGVEEIDQAARERGQVHAPQGRRGEELRPTRCRMMQPVHCPASSRGALLVRQVLDMRCILDLCAAIITA